MPQLDKYLFMSQFFWLFIIFWTLYYIIRLTILPRMITLLRTRLFYTRNLVKNARYYTRQEFYSNDSYNALLNLVSNALLKNFEKKLKKIKEIILLQIEQKLKKIKIKMNLLWKYQKNLYSMFLVKKNITRIK